MAQTVQLLEKLFLVIHNFAVNASCIHREADLGYLLKLLQSGQTVCIPSVPRLAFGLRQQIFCMAGPAQLVTENLLLRCGRLR